MSVIFHPVTDMFNFLCITGPLPYKSEAKEEKEEVVVATKVQSVKETKVKQEESVVNEMPTKRSPVNEAPSKTTKGRQEVLKVFAGLCVFTFFMLLLLSFVHKVGEVEDVSS